MEETKFNLKQYIFYQIVGKLKPSEDQSFFGSYFNYVWCFVDSIIEEIMLCDITKYKIYGGLTKSGESLVVNIGDVR